MKKIMTTLVVLLCCAMFLQMGLSIGEQRKNIRIYYIPFDAETYAAVTVDTIENSSYCVFRHGRNKKEVNSLKNIFSEKIWHVCYSNCTVEGRGDFFRAILC